MNTVIRTAYAKLNLTLDVVGAAGGYHLLDSLVSTVDLSDRVRITRRRDGEVRIRTFGEGVYLPPEENNAFLAARAFVRKFATNGVDITLWKDIPIGAGLGGSSTDTAAVIAGMGALFSVPYAEQKALADSFGSDTGYLLRGGCARLRGRGTEVEPLPHCDFYALLLCPEEPLLTAACFAEYDRAERAGGARTEACVRAFSRGDLAGAAALFGNDLYPAAASISAGAKKAYETARSFSPLGAGMTGSGGAAFAVFETRELAEWAKSRTRGLRSYVVRSTCPKRQDSE